METPCSTGFIDTFGSRVFDFSNCNLLPNDPRVVGLANYILSSVLGAVDPFTIVVRVSFSYIEDNTQKEIFVVVGQFGNIIETSPEFVNNPRLDIVNTGGAGIAGAMITFYSVDRQTRARFFVEMAAPPNKVAYRISVRNTTITQNFLIRGSETSLYPSIAARAVATPDGKQLCQLDFTVTPSQCKKFIFKQYCLDFAALICVPSCTLQAKLDKIPEPEFINYLFLRYILSGILFGEFSV